MDCDSLFGYRTQKIVIVRDRCLGMIAIFFNILIVGYLIVTVVIDRAYLRTEAPTGVSRLTIEAPAPAALPRHVGYCLDDNGGGYIRGAVMECTYWDTPQLEVPAMKGQLFVPTRAVVDKLSYDCAPTDRDCLMKSGVHAEREQVFRGFVYGVDHATIWIDHSVQGSSTVHISRTLDEMRGVLVDCDGNVVREFPKRSPQATRRETILSQLIVLEDMVRYASDGLGAGCPAERFTLDTLSGLDPVREPNNTLRYDGVFLYVVIEYDNTRAPGWSQLDEVEYRMSVIAATEADPRYITLERAADGRRVRTNRHGVYIGVAQTGQLGRFDLPRAIVSLTAGLGLLAVANVVTSLIARILMPLRDEYRKVLIEESRDFSAYRKEVRGSPKGSETPGSTATDDVGNKSEKDVDCVRLDTVVCDRSRGSRIREEGSPSGCSRASDDEPAAAVPGVMARASFGAALLPNRPLLEGGGTPRPAGGRLVGRSGLSSPGPPDTGRWHI